MQDAQIGLILRQLRRRAALRQVDAGRRTSRATVSRAEGGQLDSLTVASLRDVCAAVGATLELSVKWRGPRLERLVDARHAELCMRVVEILRRHGWEAHVEVTFSRFGERGSIDVLGLHRSSRSAVVVEVKTMIVSLEELLRTHDAKVRLAPAVVHERWGWRPIRVGRLLVVDSSTANRNRVSGSARLVQQVLSGRAADARRWLADPTIVELAAVWFMRPGRGASRGSPVGSQRVRLPRRGTESAVASGSAASSVSRSPSVPDPREPEP
jgi:hypothetical protein